jgi:hypothetical protein
MINCIYLTHGMKVVTVRNDKGSQLIANEFWHYLRDLEEKQEFIHISTH